MPHRAEARYVAADRDVIRRVGKNHLRPLVAEKPLITHQVASVSAENSVSAQNPDVTRPSHWIRVLVRNRNFILLFGTVPIQQPVDLAHFEPAELKINVPAELDDVRKFECERIHAPTGVFAESVEGKTKASELRLSETRKGHGRNSLQAKLPGRKNQTPTGDYSIHFIDDGRNNKAKLLDTRLQFSDLARRMLAGISAERP